MRENTITMNSILNIAKNDPRIRVAFQAGSRVNPLSKRDLMQDYDIIFCVKNVEDFSVDKSFLDSLNPVFIYSPEVSKKLSQDIKDEINYIVLLEDGVKIDFKFLPVEMICEIISKTTLISLLMDKDNLIKELPVSSDVGYRVLRPTKNEFEQNTYEFFYKVLEVLPYLYRGQLTGGTLAYKDVIDNLLKALSWLIAYGKDFKINMGKNYKNIDDFIDDEYKEIYFEATTFEDIEGLWKSLFACLSLYRKIGLSLAERLNFDYPKQLDVDLVRHVRGVWGKAKRLIDMQEFN